MDFSGTEGTKYLLVVFTGLVTLTAMLVAYLYVQRRAMRDAAQQRIQATIDEQESEEESEDEEEKEEDVSDNDEQAWPIDASPCPFSNMDNMSKKEIDAMNFCGHIPSQIKKAQVKATQNKIEQEMTDEQKQSERDLQREQLSAIFKMMEEQKEKFGVSSMDDVNEQMRLYL